jgi:hypothetical protein
MNLHYCSYHNLLGFLHPENFIISRIYLRDINKITLEVHMKAHELMKRINLIVNFTAKLNDEAIPYSTQKVIIRLYANDLNFNLNDSMVDNFLRSKRLA